MPQLDEALVDDLLLRLRAADALVWGGDWNHALTGPEQAGSLAGRHTPGPGRRVADLDDRPGRGGVPS